MASVFNSIFGQRVGRCPKGTKHCHWDTLQLRIQRYVPASTSKTETNKRLTLIVAPGNGFPKVIAHSSCFPKCQRRRQHMEAQIFCSCWKQATHEPFFKELYTSLEDHERSLTAICMMNCSNQGSSGEANEQCEGNSKLYVYCSSVCGYKKKPGV